MLLPGADGKTGALVVTHAGQQATLDNAYATARVKDPGEIERGQTDATAVRDAFAPALSALPPRPVTFVLYFLEATGTSSRRSRAVGCRRSSPEIAKRRRARRSSWSATPIAWAPSPTTTLLSLRARRARARRCSCSSASRAIASRSPAAASASPWSPTEDEVAEPRNRRVEISVR